PDGGDGLVHPEAQYLPADLTQEVLHAIDEPRSYAGRERVILIGPRGRAIINEFIAAGMVVDPSAPLFSPRRAREERFEAMRAIRQTRVQPSQPNRRKAKPKLQPAEGYTAHTYAHAVRVAAEKAFPCRSRCPASRVNRGAHAGAVEDEARTCGEGMAPRPSLASEPIAPSFWNRRSRKSRA
ncbi:MAG TPA: hypothetical protein VN641_08190, partial [Urbifossiella sp.]|nr:hypothetical protein [Urbifossiella sp.]